MQATIKKIGNRSGLVFDVKLGKLTGLKAGDRVNLTVHEGGRIVLTPMNPVIGIKEVRARARRLLKKNDKLFRRLA